RRISADTIAAYSNPRSHVGRLIAACWRLGRHDLTLPLSQQDQRPYARLRPWAHMLGFRGHFATKARRYSTTITAPPTAPRPGTRTDPARPHTLPTDGHPIDQVDGIEETTLVITSWQYAGTGWRTTGDAALAAMAAAAARARRPAIARPT